MNPITVLFLFPVLLLACTPGADGNNRPGDGRPADKSWILSWADEFDGNCVGAVNPVDLPLEMEVDWVRYYRKEE